MQSVVRCGEMEEIRTFFGELIGKIRKWRGTKSLKDLWFCGKCFDKQLESLKTQENFKKIKKDFKLCEIVFEANFVENLPRLFWSKKLSW